MIPWVQGWAVVLFIARSLVLSPGGVHGASQIISQADRIVLQNELRLVVCEDRSLPMVTVRLLIDAGSRRDPSGREGLANLTVRGLFLGTSEHTTNAIHEMFDAMGVSTTISAEKDFVVLGLQVLKKDFHEAMRLLVELITQPTFPEQEIQKDVNRLLGEIQSDEDRPGRAANELFDEALFADSPYGHPVKGSFESLLNLTRQQVVEFYRAYYQPGNAVLCVAGDIASTEAKADLIPILLKWQMKGEHKERELTACMMGPETIRMQRNITQANIVLGHKGVARDDPDYYALQVMNHILGGGGFGSRLFEEIRVKRGLTYRVTSLLEAMKYAGSFQIMLQTKNASAGEAIAICQEQMQRIRDELVTQEELDLAKKYLTGSFPLRIDSLRELADFITQAEYYGLGLDYPERYPALIGSVTREDVLRVARAHLHPDRCILVIIGNFKEGEEEKSR
jgi:zinc protease